MPHDEFDWPGLLQDLSREVIKSENVRRYLPEQSIEDEWLGFPPASESEIEDAEGRLDTQFPPSYRSFLQTTNGWMWTGPFIAHLWSTSDIAWFQERNQEWIDAFLEPSKSIPEPTDTEYFVYGEEQSTSSIRVRYLQTALEVSESFDGAVYLLNPKVVATDGEWEAWDFANWSAGAARYRSFWDLMCQALQWLRNNPPLP